MPAVISITFDPVLQLSDTASVRYETIALAVVLLIGLVLAGRMGSMTPASVAGPGVPVPGLRLDDMAFAVIGSVPGAVLGARLGYVLDHLDVYGANPGAIVDPTQGGLTLTLAVPFAIITGAAITRLLAAPVSRWLHAITLPMLFVLGAGKAIGVLGATGQGSASDLPWATSYVGPGPWGSLGADVAAHPSELYEAILVGVVVLLLALASRTRAFARMDGRLLYAALALWALARFAVAFTWRDPAMVGPLRAEQIQALAVALIAAVAYLRRRRAPVEVATGPERVLAQEAAPLAEPASSPDLEPGAEAHPA